MCRDCWEEYGSPAEDSPEIRRAVALIESIYETEPTGAPLHCALDDWNLEDTFWEPYQPARENDWLYDPAKWDVAVELSDLMRSMSLSARASALARERGYV